MSHEDDPQAQGAQVERELPEGPAGIFASAYPVLSKLLGDGCISLGGGTALAAVWGHRHSTDVDLFADSAAYVELVSSERGRRLLSDGLREAFQPDQMDIQRGYLRLLSPAGELSIMTSPSPLPPLLATDRVANTQVSLERPATILARKLRGRMLTNGVLVLRDLYDLAAATTLAPDELKMALASLSDADRRDITDELRRLPAGWAAAPKESGRPVIDPARPAELAKDPAQAVVVVRKLLSKNSTYRLRREPPGNRQEP